MRFRNVLLIIGILALTIGVVMSGLWITRPSVRNLTMDDRKAMHEAILVAAHPIAAGLLLRAEDMHWKEVASSDVSPAYIARGRASDVDYVGAVARRDFDAGEPLVATALVRPQERGFLAAVLAPGMRAVTIIVNAPQSSSGLLLPGDRIDVILTQRFNDAAIGLAHQVVGETVLHDLRIIAVDQKLSVAPGSPSADRASGQIPKTVTVEVTGHDAEKLLVAAELGNVGVAVRPLEGTSSTDTQASSTVWAADVSPALGTLEQAPSSTAGAGPNKWSATPVQVIHGSKIEVR
jgi:pilus assembly protein CpaB